MPAMLYILIIYTLAAFFIPVFHYTKFFQNRTLIRITSTLNILGMIAIATLGLLELLHSGLNPWFLWEGGGWVEYSCIVVLFLLMCLRKYRTWHFSIPLNMLIIWIVFFIIEQYYTPVHI